MQKKRKAFARAKERELVMMKALEWVSGKGKAGDSGARFASKRLLRLKPESLTYSQLSANVCVVSLFPFSSSLYCVCQRKILKPCKT